MKPIRPTPGSNCQVRPLIEGQFTLGHLFAGFWVVAVVVGTILCFRFRTDNAVLFLGLPAAALGYEVISYGRVRLAPWIPQNAGLAWLRACPFIACFVSVMAACAVHGLPATAATWLLVTLGLLASAICAWRLRGALWVTMNLLLLLWLGNLAVWAFPFYYAYIDDVVDLRNGRFGVRYSLPVQGIGPGLLDDTPELIFARSGPNTTLLRSYLGRCTPEWTLSGGRWFCAPRSAPVLRNGSHQPPDALLLRAELGQCLKMFPSDVAKRRVLGCLTDKGNLLRFHQGLLLVALEVNGYPGDYDAATWWDKHESLFQPVYDRGEAGRMVKGWTAGFQEMLRRTDPDASTHQILKQQLEHAMLQEELFQMDEVQAVWREEKPKNIVWWQDQSRYQ